MPLRLYMDHDSEDSRVVRGLRTEGIDVLTSFEAGNALLSDEGQLEFASSERHCIYSANVADFARLHAAWMNGGRHHAGIILRTRQALPIGAQIRALLGLLTRHLPEDVDDSILFLES